MSIKLLPFSKRTSAIFAFVSLSLVSYLDYITSIELSMSAFYLLPVLLIALQFGKPIGIFAATIIAIVQTAVHMTGHSFYYSYPLFLLWNTSIHMIVYIVVSVLISTLRDVYKREQEKAEELSRSNADLKQFAYAASHDLKEPLRNISGFVKLLQKRYKGKLDEKADEFIDHIVNGVERMDMLIHDLLEYSQVETRGKDFRPVNCSVALQEAVNNVRSAIEKSGVELTYDPLPTVIADSFQLSRLFQNLISNAIKFRGNDPLKIHISAQQKGDKWIFSVRDNGIGIDPQYFKRIFLIFQRLHTTSEYEGTGLGLAICKKIVERYGGQIWVESEEGKGSTFYFTIPVRRTNI